MMKNILTQNEGIAKASETLSELYRIEKECREEYFLETDAEELRIQNRSLFSAETDAYEDSYLNPDYAVREAGEIYGPFISYLNYQVRSIIPAAFTHNTAMLDRAAVLVDEITALYEDGAPRREYSKAVREYELKMRYLRKEEELNKQYSRQGNFYTDIIEESDLSSPSYLYRFGHYIGDNEIWMSAYLNSLPAEAIQKMADCVVNPFIESFAERGKSFEGFESILIVYPLGFERLLKVLIGDFRKYGLRVCIPNVFFSTKTTRQLKYDRAKDDSLYLEKTFVDQAIENEKALYKKYENEILAGAGYAMVCIFGEMPFSPKSRTFSLSYEPLQLEYKKSLEMAQMQLKFKYADRQRTSYTASGYPVPSIGEDFEAIFRETLEINSMDNLKYSEIHSLMIEALDKAEYVRVTGGKGNRTDLTVRIARPEDPVSQTAFSNCIATVNVPLGEVYTTPVLEGTGGTLHVSGVYLFGLHYKDLVLVFENGMIVDYSCGNFDTREAGREYIRENLFGTHKSLPMGEFAVGTNTRAYRMARDYGIAHLLPILIAEKAGPHFALGDTCYRGNENTLLTNPDGKEITAKSNGLDYTYKHIDVSLPFEEIGAMTLVMPGGDETPLIKDGFFQGAFSNELNYYLKNMED